ncbi:MAG: rhomboid family intramembrane serine protease [Myxococcales bacterium]|nr:rhomboid family intramembrane serine protease [Myxococcales bacterium]
MNDGVASERGAGRSGVLAAWEAAFAEAPLTGWLFVANLAIFAAQVSWSGSIQAAMSVPAQTMLFFGANASDWTIADSRFETLVTACFLHFSILHLGFNLLALRQVGPFLERAVGQGRFAVTYLAAGVVGSAASAIVGRLSMQPRLSAGASGAICGLIGAALVLGLRTQGTKGPLTRAMARWLGIVIVVGFAARFDNAAHIGGAAAGAILAATWRRGQVYSALKRRIIVGLCALITIGSAVTVWHKNRTDPLTFLNGEERVRYALKAFRDGKCDEARRAIRRAIKMDPKNGAVSALTDEIDRECAAHPAPGAPAR